MRRQFVVIALGVVLAFAVFSPTVSLSDTNAERDVSVSIADADDALLAFWDPGGPSPEPPRYPGENPITKRSDTVGVVVVANNYDDRTLAVSVTDRSSSRVDVDGVQTTIDPNGIAPIRAEVDCSQIDGRRAVTVPVTIDASTTDGSYETTIDTTLRLVCAVPTTNENATTTSENATTTSENATTTSENATTTNENATTTNENATTTSENATTESGNATPANGNATTANASTRL
jgi:hypothetical protein